jgi:hypothetical protein
VPEEPYPDRGRGLIEPPGEDEIGDGRVDDARGVVVCDGKGPASTREHRLQHVCGLNARIVDPAVAEEDEFERSGGPIGDDHEEPLAIAVQQLRPDDVRHGFVVDQSRPRRRSAGSPPDLDDRNQSPSGRRPDAGEGLEPREVHRRKTGETACATQDRSRQCSDAPTRLAGAENESEDFVVCERSDAQASHPLTRTIVQGDVRKGLLLVWVLVGHATTLRSLTTYRPRPRKPGDNDLVVDTVESGTNAIHRLRDRRSVH